MFSPALLAAIAIGTPDPDLHYKLKTNYLSRTLSPTCSVPRTVSSSLTLPQPHKIKLFGETRGKRYAMNRVGCAFSDNEAWTDGPQRSGWLPPRSVLSTHDRREMWCNLHMTTDNTKLVWLFDYTSHQLLTSAFYYPTAYRIFTLLFLL